ncbi:hypothetical protein ACB087_01940 [Vibrio sp. VNB-15]
MKTVKLKLAKTIKQAATLMRAASDLNIKMDAENAVSNTILFKQLKAIEKKFKFKVDINYNGDDSEIIKFPHITVRNKNGEFAKVIASSDGILTLNPFDGVEEFINTSIKQETMVDCSDNHVKHASVEEAEVVPVIFEIYGLGVPA